MDPSITSVSWQISWKGVPFAHSYTTYAHHAVRQLPVHISSDACITNLTNLSGMQAARGRGRGALELPVTAMDAASAGRGLCAPGRRDGGPGAGGGAREQHLKAWLYASEAAGHGHAANSGVGPRVHGTLLWTS
jgi:hypothetical protein